MSRDAFDELLDGVELTQRQRPLIKGLLVRAEADGYLRRAKEEYAEGPKGRPGKVEAGEEAGGQGRKKPSKRKQKPSPAPKHIEEFFRATDPASAGPKDIVRGVEQRHNTRLAFTQVRRAVDALVEKGVLEQLGEKSWRLNQGAKANGSVA